VPKISELKQMAAGRASLSQLPNEFYGKIIREEVRTDNRGRDCLYWVIAVEGIGTITQKFSPMHIDALTRVLEALKVESTDELKGKRILFRSQRFSIGNPRWFPVEVEKELTE